MLRTEGYDAFRSAKRSSGWGASPGGWKHLLVIRRCTHLWLGTLIIAMHRMTDEKDGPDRLRTMLHWMRDSGPDDFDAREAVFRLSGPSGILGMMRAPEPGTPMNMVYLTRVRFVQQWAATAEMTPTLQDVERYAR